MSDIVRPLRLTLVGDDMVGKSSFHKKFEEDIFVEGKEYKLDLWGTEGHGKLSDIIWSQTDCFLLCYSVDNRKSFKNVKKIWWPQISRFSESKNIPVILIGTKIDLRDSNSKKFVTAKEGLRLCEEICAYSLIECSTKEEVNLQKVFREAVFAIENAEDIRAVEKLIGSAMKAVSTTSSSVREKKSDHHTTVLSFLMFFSKQ